jgi:hypothetical protein
MISITPAAGAVASVVLTTLATAPPAAAEPDVMGAYTFEAEDGESATWTMAPCAGNNPGCVRVSETGNSKRAPWSAEAHLSVGSWIMFAAQPDAILCKDGSAVPGVNTYSWDATTLSGSASILSKGACGTEPASISIPFALTKTGAGPVQYPNAPVDVEPLAPIPPAAAAVPMAPPPPGPLPAEAPPAEVATPPVVAPPAGQLTEAEVAEPGFNAGR